MSMSNSGAPEPSREVFGRQPGRGGQHKIGAEQFRCQVVERGRVTAELCRELRATVEGAVGHDDLDTGARQRTHDSLAHLARSDDHDPATFQITQTGPGQVDCGVGHRRGRSADRGFGSGTFADLDRMAKQQIQRRSRRPVVAGNIPSGANLAQDLGLTEHIGLDTRRNREKMIDGTIVMVAVQMLGDLIGAYITEQTQGIADVSIGAVETFGDGVDLGAVAGRQHDRLGDVRARTQIVKHFASVRPA